LAVVASYERSLKRLVDAYEAGALELEDLTARTERLKPQLQRAREALGQAEAKLTETITLHAVTSRLHDFAARVGQGLDQLTWHDRRHLIRTLVSRVEIDNDGATVVFRLPPAAPPPPESNGELGGLPAGDGPVAKRQLLGELGDLGHGLGLGVARSDVGRDADGALAVEAAYRLQHRGLLLGHHQGERDALAGGARL
jgi:site-specific DNA recombinase